MRRISPAGAERGLALWAERAPDALLLRAAAAHAHGAAVAICVGRLPRARRAHALVATATSIATRRAGNGRAAAARHPRACCTRRREGTPLPIRGSAAVVDGPTAALAQERSRWRYNFFRRRALPCGRPAAASVDLGRHSGVAVCRAQQHRRAGGGAKVGMCADALRGHATPLRRLGHACDTHCSRFAWFTWLLLRFQLERVAWRAHTCSGW